MTTKTRPADNSRFAFLGEILVERGVIARDELELAIQEQKRRKVVLGKILVESGFCSEEDIALSLADQLGLDFVKIDDHEIDRASAENLGDSFLRQGLVLPLIVPGSVTVRLAVADPFDVEKSSAVETRLGRPIEVVVATQAEILQGIDRLLDDASKVDAMLSGISAAEANADTILDRVSAEELIHQIAREAARRGATDIHLEPEAHVMRVRYRVDGVLADGPMIHVQLAPAVIARIKVMSDLDLSEHRLPQDGRARIELDGNPMDWRVSVLPTVLGENVVIRVLDGKTVLLDPRDLGLSERNHRDLLDLCARPHGVLLVTGPTGSGKSTTLYSLLRTIDGLRKKIVTVEDPVEYRIPLVRQVQTHAEIGFTFATALRSILRQDPDVILIGEIRDRETAEIAIRAALTGHLVFSTLHTNSALGAIPRLLDMGVDPFLLKSSLIGVLAQRLIRRVCKSCSTEYRPTDDELATFAAHDLPERVVLKRANGCPRCRETGYSGRSGIHELLVVTEKLKTLSFAADGPEKLETLAREGGFRSLRDDGLDKALSGLTTLEEIARLTGAQ
ncbi:MAG: GspE/PulE family protein [Planctomycetota bacterium]